MSNDNRKECWKQVEAIGNNRTDLLVSLCSCTWSGGDEERKGIEFDG